MKTLLALSCATACLLLVGCSGSDSDEGIAEGRHGVGARSRRGQRDEVFVNFRA